VWRPRLGSALVASVLIAAGAVAAAPQHPARRQARPSLAAVPILMYHVVAAPPPDAPFPGLYVEPADFAAQIDALARAGYHGVTQDQMLAAWRGAGRLPRHPIVISFDNGYRSQYERALPILSGVGWVADENLQLHGLPSSAGGLSAHEVRALVAAGWELDTQGWSHADLTAVGPSRLAFEIGVARRRIRRLYGVAANWFCYPSGRFNPAVVAAVQAAGYVGATTVVPGWARPTDNLYELPRLRVLAGTSPAALLAQIRSAAADPLPPSSYLSAG
jgi:peptidoglycan/xylan/chitin deacetylase (PgdA/CDA1 family)